MDVVFGTFTRQSIFPMTYPGETRMPLLNDSGEVAFLADLLVGAGGVTADNKRGIWSEGTGALDLLVRQGNQADDIAPGGLYGNPLSGIDFNNNGAVVVPVLLVPGTGDVTVDNDFGFWIASGGAPSLLYRQGDQAPGLSPGIEMLGGFAHLNELDHVGFHVDFSTGSEDRGVWTNPNGPMELLAREGGQAPGFADGIEFNDINTRLAFNDADHVAFFAELNNGVEGIWSDRSGSLELEFRRGDQAPGAPPAWTFKFFSYEFITSFSNADHIAFAAESENNDYGVWVDDGTTTRLVALSGDPAPDLPGLAMEFLYETLVNDSGETIVHGFVSGPGVSGSNDEVLWSEGFGPLAVVARGGTQAPESDAGVLFDEFIFYKFNNLGQTALEATLQGSVDAGSDRGVWAQDASGILRLIAREGDQLEVAPGDFRTIALVEFSDFNNLGQVAFAASFTDGTEGVFVSDLVAVPEPATLVLALCAICMLACGALRRGRNRPRSC